MYGPPSRITERDLELIDEIDQEDDAVDNEVDEATMTEDNRNGLHSWKCCGQRSLCYATI